MKRFGRAALGALLACSLVPISTGAAAADEAADSPNASFAPGTYVEHEAIAYVIDNGVRTFSLGNDPLDNAEGLMDIDADAATEALGDDLGGDGARAARSRSADNARQTAAGRLVLVRDEGKTTEQLIAELESDERVAFAEPNAIVKSDDVDVEVDATDAIVEPTEEVADGEGGTRQTDEAKDGGEEGNAIDGNEALAAGGSESDEPSAASSGIVLGRDENDPATDINSFVWGFSNDGRMGGMPQDKAIDMSYGNWNNRDAAKQLKEVVVAVIDGGVDATNPDLAPVMWDKGLESGIEQTGKEDKHGFAAVAGKDISSTEGLSSYHGTHVAGTIGAAWDGAGISGLAGNAKIMAVRHNDTLSGMLECFDYVSRACDAGVGVRVANNSWGFGQTQLRSIDLAVTELGQQGVVSVFASGNSAFDNDAAASTAGVLADNPYVVVVDAIDATGDPTPFTQFGETTTDVMAPGGTILSTYATGGPDATAGPQYLGEEDDEAALYESFDDESHCPSGVDMSEFSSFTAGSIVEGGYRFDGEGALALSYSPESAGAGNLAVVESGAVDLSGLAEKPTHLSVRYAGTAGGDSVATRLMVGVRTVVDGDGDDGWAKLPVAEGAFGMGGDAWAGLSGRLPEDVDWEHFQIRIGFAIVEFSMVGGLKSLGSYVPGTVLVDSIGMGSDLVPYTYMQGTSMACPAVAGAAAVIAGQGLDNVDSTDMSKSAEKLAALVKGAAEPDERYEGMCSTGGYATVDGAADPGPAITEVVDNGSSVSVRGYFMPQGDTEVWLDDAAASVSGRIDLGDDKTELTVQKPEGFAGGQTVVQVKSNGKQANQRVDLGKRVDVAYYDQTNLPVPDELSMWGSWQLVGFNGDVYCLPRTSLFDADKTYDHLLCYDPDVKMWGKVSLPACTADGVAVSSGVVDVSGATLDGALVLQLTDAKSVSFVRYTADGAWESLAFEFAGLDTAPVASTLGSDGEYLYVLGGLIDDGDSAKVFRADLASRIFEEAGELSMGRIRPQVTYGNGSFMVSGGISGRIQMGGLPGAELLKPQQADLDPAAEKGAAAGWLVGTPVDFSSLVTETGQLAYASGVVEDGFALAGPVSKDGKADTYLLSEGEAPSVTAYGKKASEQAFLAPAATAYHGQFYVLAGSQNNPYRVFSATAMETVPQPGDAAVPPKPVPDPTPTPDPAPVPDVPGDASRSATSEQLVRTGDQFKAAPLALVALAAAVALGGLTVRRCSRKER